MKPIIGILKDSSEKVKDFSDKEYYIEYINDHVKKVGKSLLKTDLGDEEIDKVRSRGCKVSSRFWVNLALMSAKANNENNLKIVIADLQEEDNKSIFSKIV